MWKTAIEIMGGKYVPNGTLNIDPKKIKTIRYYFSQFGLGIPTGIGFDNEIAGMINLGLLIILKEAIVKKGSGKNPLPRREG